MNNNRATNPDNVEKPLPDFHRTDAGNAKKLIYHFGEMVRYSYERKNWLFYDGVRWLWDDGGRIVELAKETVKILHLEGIAETDDAIRQDKLKFAAKSENERSIRAMIELARSEPGIPLKLEQLDPDPWLLNCPNGTIDLKTAQLKPHNSADLITKLVPVAYSPGAPRPMWESFLNRITGGDEGLSGFLRRGVGYSLTGDVRCQVVFYVYGLGGNGKTTFLGEIKKVSGDYSGKIHNDWLTEKAGNFSRPKEGLANLAGKRFVLSSEFERTQRLALGTIKDFSGGETYTADRKYEHEFEFKPVGKLWMYGNYLPLIIDNTSSVWRRFRLIPFNIEIGENERIEDLIGLLEAELPGILAWAIEGCLEWQQIGLAEPPIVKQATANWQREQDPLADFIEDSCVIQPNAKTSKNCLRTKYEQWCEANGITPLKLWHFKRALTDRGIKDGHSGPERYWAGIRLKDGIVDVGQLGQ